MTDQMQYRVILVGLASMAPSLRKSEEIELIRSRTPLDALGELSALRRSANGAKTAVLVARDVLPASEAGEFVSAARTVAPDAALVQLAEHNGGADPWDGHLAENAAAGDLMELLRLGREESGSAVTTSAPAATVAPPTATEPALETVEPIAFAEDMLSGRDPTNSAVAAVRAASGASDLEFISRGDQDAAPAGNAAPVARRGALFGWLRSASLDRDALQTQADALAAWLALREQHKQLTEAAFTDPLTGAWNRRYLERYLSSAVDRARRDRRDVTVLLFDIDDFKIYNDTYGHGAGDEILQETVRLIQSVIRPTDRVCRLGGDEFVVIFDDPEGPRTPNSHHPASIAEIAKRFQRQICNHRFPKLGSEAPGTLGVSGGIATFPWDGSDPESLLERADQLALESKRQGKNAITMGPGAERVCSRS